MIMKIPLLLKCAAAHAKSPIPSAAAAYGGTVMSCAFQVANPRPAMIVGRNREKE